MNCVKESNATQGRLSYLYPELLQAHHENDKAVMRAYGFWVVMSIFAVFGIVWIYREIKKK